MLISDFIKNSNVINKFGSTLPIPYIENILINDQDLDIYLSVYIHIPEVIYSAGADAVREFFQTFSNLDIILATLIDRDTVTNAAGFSTNSGFQTGGTESFMDYPINGFTNVTSGADSIIRYASHQADANDQYLVTSKFTLPDLVSERPDLLSDIHRELYNKNTFNGAAAFFGYIFPDGTRMTAGVAESDSGQEYKEYVDSLVADGRYETAEEAGLPLVNEMILSEIKKQNYTVIKDTFGLIAYTPLSAPSGPKTYEHVNEPFFTGDLATIDQNIAHTRVLINPILDTSKLEVWSGADILENNDGSAYYKLSRNFKVDQEQLSGQIFGKEFTKSTGVKDFGFVAYSAPEALSTKDNKLKIISAFKQNSGARKVYETAISGINYVHFIKNGGINFEPIEIYLDENEVFYDNAMLSIDGNYYDISQVTPEAIVGDMQAIDTTGLPMDTYNAFQYLLATSLSNPVEMIPEMNIFRGVFPEKSTATQMGQFYDKFSEVLFNANTRLQQGTPLVKALVNNPIVKDLRTTSTTSGHSDRTVYGSADSIREGLYDCFSLEDALWGRYTEVTGREIDDEGAVMVQEETDYIAGINTETTYSGGQWNYNFIDHGFVFFNMEKALIKSAYISQFINLELFEKYFGQKVVNSLFKMKKVMFKSYYATDITDEVAPTGIMCAEIDPNGLTTKISFDKHDFNKGYVGLNEDKFSIFVDNDATQATAENGYIETSKGVRLIDDYGGANGMISDREYSFISFRGFSPISIQPDANPLVVNDMFLTNEDINYRLACFEIQKCDYFDGYDARFEGTRITSEGNLSEIASLGMKTAFKASLLVEDSTVYILQYLYDIISEVYSDFGKYAAAAADTCSYNDETDTFNDFFVTTTKTNWPNQWTSPYFRAASIGLMIEDILFLTSKGDDLETLASIDNVFMAISPETGTLTAIKNHIERLATVVNYLKSLVDSFLTEAADKEHGIIYGHNASYYPTYEEADSVFKGFCVGLQGEEYIQGSESGGTPKEFRPYVFAGSYANFPKFPTTSVDTIESVTDTSPSISAEPLPGTEDGPDVTSGKNTIIESILEGIDVGRDRINAMVDMLNDWIARTEDRLGIMDHTITPLDIFEELYTDVHTTFPDIQNDIINDIGAYNYAGVDAAGAYDFLANAETLAPVFDSIINNAIDLFERDGISAFDNTELSNFSSIVTNLALTNTAQSFTSTANYLNNKVTPISSLVMVAAPTHISSAGRGSSAAVASSMRDFRGY